MFLGQTESLLLIAKYLGKMTKAEIFMVLISGMGSMSVSILGGYNALGVPMNLLIISCSLIPFGSIIMGKILFPETENPLTDNIKVDTSSTGCNAIEALGNGTMDGMRMALAIAASLAAIVSVIAMINGVLSPLNVKLENMLSYLFYPVSYLMGIGDEFRMLVAEILGSKLVLNEFIAFTQLVPHLGGMDFRTQAITCVSVAGFANIGSMAVCVSSIGTLFPARKGLIALLVGRALLGAFCLNLFNCFIVGLILSFS